MIVQIELGNFVILLEFFIWVRKVPQLDAKIFLYRYLSLYKKKDFFL